MRYLSINLEGGRVLSHFDWFFFPFPYVIQTELGKRKGNI